MSDAIQQFRNALAEAGIMLAPRSQIIADGKLHRAPLVTDRPGQKTAWYRLHLDQPIAGAGGDWRQGLSVRWCSKRQQALTHAEREVLRLRIEQDKARAQAELAARHRIAAAKAARIWASSAPACPDHPYLTRKGIAPGISRQSGNALVLPIVGFDGQLYGLQFIDEQGGKRFISGMAKAGHFIPIDKIPNGSQPLYIAEGWATSATLQTLKPDVCVIAALDCGNLQSVAQTARAKWPDISLVIAPDFDKVGQEKGKAAAIAARAMILPMPAHIPDGATDWNDVIQARRQGVHHDF